jgi:hypothetical protein
MGTLPPEFFLLVVAIISAIFGGLLIWLLGYISGDKPSSNQSPTAATSAEPETASTDEQELLRVSRTTRGVVVFVQGQRYRHLREVANSQMGHETIEALKVVLAFAEGWLPTPQQSSPALPKPPVAPGGFLDQLRQRDKFSDKASEPSQPGPLSMVREINELVQQRLRKRPELAKQRVRLISGEDGNLYIYVGHQTFSSVGDIPDPQVQTLIQDAIREWESS